MAMPYMFMGHCKHKSSDSIERKNKHRPSQEYKEYLLSRKTGLSNENSRLRGFTRAEESWGLARDFLPDTYCSQPATPLSASIPTAMLLETHAVMSCGLTWINAGCPPKPISITPIPQLYRGEEI